MARLLNSFIFYRRANVSPAPHLSLSHFRYWVKITALTGASAERALTDGKALQARMAVVTGWKGEELNRGVTELRRVETSIRILFLFIRDCFRLAPISSRVLICRGWGGVG